MAFFTGDSSAVSDVEEGDVGENSSGQLRGDVEQQLHYQSFPEGRAPGGWKDHPIVAVATARGVQFHHSYAGSNNSHYLGSTLRPRDR